MFGLVIEIGGRPDGADDVRKAHVRYSELAKDHPGILYKHVMHSRDNGSKYFDVMVWETQEQSEAFGVDPEYQKHRTGPMKIPTGPRGWMNPGYSHEVFEHGHTTSDATTQLIALYHVTPGREREFEAAARAVCDAIGNRVSSFILYQNNGKPNRYAAVIQNIAEADEAALTPLAEFTASEPEIDRGDIIVRYDFR